jgi:hypothetical protein
MQQHSLGYIVFDLVFIALHPAVNTAQMGESGFAIFF